MTASWGCNTSCDKREPVGGFENLWHVPGKPRRMHRYAGLFTCPGKGSGGTSSSHLKNTQVRQKQEVKAKAQLS
jgi:hypothetical protein